jgi:predicted acylesterase/phospholipase RssA
MHREHDYLVISGGGAKGAYGAGVLVAWSKLGTRPEFTMDAGRPMVWNVTRIAASGHPGATKLIRQILLASSSIPGSFPPVYIEVETPDGRKYNEIHVDGGAFRLWL